MKLKGKRVLITGGGGGIGLNMAHEFAKQGCEIILTDINEEALKKAEGELRAQARKLQTYVNDVSDWKDVKNLADRILSGTGTVDVLINNAGIGFSAEISETSIEDWKRLIGINIWGPIHFIKAFLPAMIAQKSGSIVNISSGQAFFPVPTWGAYAATKFFLAGFSDVLHYEVARHGISVTTVFPYVVQTPFYSDIRTDTFGKKMMIKLLPLYSTSPEKIAKMIVDAVRKGKKYEMHHIINKMGYYFGRLFPPVVDSVGHTIAWSLGRQKEKETEKEPEASPQAATPIARGTKAGSRGSKTKRA